MTIFFIFYSSLFGWVRLGLVCITLLLWQRYSRVATPHPDVWELHYVNKQWQFKGLDQKIEHYEQITVLIANPLFQLLRASTANKKKLYVFFNDQCSSADWRAIRLLSDWCENT